MKPLPHKQQCVPEHNKKRKKTHKRKKKKTGISILLVINFGPFAANLKEGSIDERRRVCYVLQSPRSTALIMENMPEQQHLYMHTCTVTA